MTRTRKQLRTARSTFAAQRTESTFSRIRTAQTSLLARLLELILSFDTDESGALQPQVSNYRKATEVSLIVSSFSASFKETFAGFLAKGISRIVTLNRTYFKTIDTNFGSKTIEDKVRSATLERLGFATELSMKGKPVASVVAGSWLDAQLGNEALKVDVMKRVNNALSSRMPLKDFVTAFRSDFTDNTKGLGLLSRHYRTFVQDLYMSTDRQVQMEYARATGLKYFIYSGTAKTTTRKFCHERMNRIYTLQEIEKWNALDWAGKNKNVDVRVSLGGYNCRHHLSAISEQTAKAIATRTKKEVDSYARV